MQLIETEKKPIRMWLETIESGAMAQIKNLANLPFLFSHVAIMPDSHQGYGMPIGGVIATTDVNTIGIIPGSQGTKSYIVKGKGNILSFKSCSHGAGRTMGRNEAIKNLDLQSEIKKLDDKGIIHSIRGAKDLDEAPGAYKDIDIVMKNQQDLVEVLVELTPLAVIKG